MKVPGRPELVSLCFATLLLWSSAAGGAPADTAPSKTAPANGAQGKAGAPADTAPSKTAPADSAQGKAGAPADTTQGNTGAPDSTQTAGGAADSTQGKADTTAVGRFVPSSTSYVRGGDADMSIGSSMDLVTNAGGWSIRNSISMDRRKYRGLSMEDMTESIANQARKNMPGLWSFDFGVGEQYSKRTTLALARFGKDVVNDNQSASLNFVLTKPVLGASLSRFAVSASGRKGLNDFKYDRSLNGMMSSTLSYFFFDVLNVGGGYGTTRRRESSEVGRLNFGAMPSTSDTARALMTIGRGTGAKLLSVDYKRSSGQERRVTPPRGNSLQILDDPSKAKRERIKTGSEALTVSSALAPFPFLSMGLQLNHNVDGQTYAVDSALTKRSRADKIAASMSYRYAAHGDMSVGVTSSKTLDDFGRLSLSSYREREHAINASLSQKMGDSLTISLKGSGWLKQRFFLKADRNPRDADYLYYQGEFNFRTAYSDVGAAVKALATKSQTINIDASVSGDNRVEYQYIVVPQLSIKAADWVRISQEYTIKIEYTDFTYTANKNYLNRTTQLNTRADFVIAEPLRFAFTHGYYMNDTGSYLDYPGGKRLYAPNSENREHRLYFDMKYDPMPDAFAVRASADFAIQRMNYLGSRNGHRVVVGYDIFESGGLMIGFSRHKKIASLGEVNLDIGYNRRYGPHLTPERKEFWDVDSGIVLNF